MKGFAHLVHACAWLLVALALSVSTSAIARSQADPPQDHLSVPGPLRLGGETFHFAWSSHPAPAFYKHEYLPDGETLGRYRQMLMLDLLVSDTLPAQAALAKVEELKARQGTDPVVNWDVLAEEGGDAVILDFVLSAPGADGATIVEWNAYRYERIAEGLVVFAVSRRAYGMDDIRRFLGEDLKRNKSRWVQELAGAALPQIALEPAE